MDVLDSDVVELNPSEDQSECQHMELSSCVFYGTRDGQIA